MKLVATLLLMACSAFTQEYDIAGLEHENYEVREQHTRNLVDPPENVDKAKYITNLLILSKYYKYSHPEVSLRFQLAARECFNKYLLFKDRIFAKLFGFSGLMTYWLNWESPSALIEYVHPDMDKLFKNGDMVIDASSEDAEYKDFTLEDWQFVLNDNYNNMVPDTRIKVKFKRLNNVEDLLYFDGRGEPQRKYGEALLEIFTDPTKYTVHEVEYKSGRKSLDQIDRDDYFEQYENAWFRFVNKTIPIENPTSIGGMLMWGLNQIFEWTNGEP